MQNEENSYHMQIFAIVILTAFIALAGKLWSLQVVSGSELRKLAEGNRIRAIQLESPRGSIYDRNGKLLVGNKQSIIVTLSPSKLNNDKTIKKLVALLGISPEEINKRIEAQNKKLTAYAPRIIADEVDISTATRIAEQKNILPGVDVQARATRDYPNDSIAAHVLGYVGEISDKELQDLKDADYSNGDLVGKMGIERSYESILKGQKGGRQIEVDAAGRLKRILSNRDPIPGHSLGLTIDVNIQKIAEESLAKAIRTARKLGARRASAGAVVVLDPDNGEVLALASAPTFNPEDFGGGIKPQIWRALNDKKSNYPLNNRAIMSAYPPGSTFKPVTAVAGEMSKLISASSTVVCNGKWYGSGRKWPKSCWKKKGHGRVNLVSAMAESCDVYFYEIGFKLWRQRSEKLQEASRLFGFGALTGIDLPWEKAGRVPNREWKKQWNRNNPSNQVWLPGDNVNLSIGQGDMLSTPLQIANLYSAVANGGSIYKPHVLKTIISSDGMAVRAPDPIAIYKGLGGKLSISMNSGLRQVVSRGTAKGAFASFPIKTAGKTGTSQVWGKEDFALFAGYGPLPDPKYVVVMVIEEGKSGGSVAAPAVREVFGRIFDLPDNVIEVKGVVDHSR